MVNVTIDGKQASVPEGTSILKAAVSVGIQIPTLCYHFKLSPIGACRVCLVEVAGEKRPAASCDTPVREGMVIRTDTEEIVRQRREMVQLMLVNHPLDCPVCDKAGECEVQDIAVKLGVTEQPFTATKAEKQKGELSPVLDLWHNRCIMCGRCVQVCKEIQGARAIDYVVRSGFASRVGPTEQDGYPCESCSQCLTVCPVGVILDSTFRYSARAWQLTDKDSICTFCGDGCSYQLGVRQDKVYRVAVREFHGLNRGNLCSVGRWGRDIIHSESRLTNPAVRTNDRLENADWNEALDYATRRLKDIVASEGGNSVAGLASASCSNEALFSFQRLMREGLGSHRIDTTAHLSNFALIETTTDVYGVPACPGNLSDLDEADTVLVIDSNIITTHPVAALELLRVHHSGSAKVLVIGHRSNKLTTQCSQFARTTPGSEVAVLNCLANMLVEKGAPDDAALGKSTDGYDKLKVHLAGYKLPEVAAGTGIDPSVLSDMGQAIAESKKFLLVLSPGSLHSAVNASIARAAANIALLKEGTVLSLLREGNAHGALDMGVSPDYLPGYREATEGRTGPLEVCDILRGIEAGEIKALYLMGGDIQGELALLGLPMQSLRALDLLIVQDILGSPVAEMADVVLPACSAAEQEASYTNAWRVVQRVQPAIKPVGQCRPDAEILSDLGHRLGLSALISTEAVRAQITATAPMYDFGGKKSTGVGWDYAKVASAARRAFSVASESKDRADEAHPYAVTFDKMLHVGGSASLHSTSLTKIRLDRVVEISEEDARALDVADGASVQVTVRSGGSATLPVRISRELPAGVINVPMHRFAEIQSLIGKLEASALIAEQGAPVWFASVKTTKD
jgi:predicted molibdopterin-dependent oxidoreductase YjgC